MKRKCPSEQVKNKRRDGGMEHAFVLGSWTVRLQTKQKAKA
jgi:hypothetical protein